MTDNPLAEVCWQDYEPDIGEAIMDALVEQKLKDAVWITRLRLWQEVGPTVYPDVLPPK